jgi:hypothetical protein
MTVGTESIHVARLPLLRGERGGADSIVRGLPLAHQIGTVEYSLPRRFRAMLDQWLDVIRGLWPSC